jgi:putative ABC transport system permease protein
MLRNYFKIAWRNLAKNKLYSFINITGLATGMAVAMLIGLWMYDELSFNQYHKHYDRIAQIWQFVTFDGKKVPYNVLPIPLSAELRSKYPDFEAISLAKPTGDMIIAVGDTRVSKIGQYVEPDFLRMMSVRMRAGTHKGLSEVNSILLSESVATALFGSTNPLNRLIRINDKATVRVTGVYEDFPANSSFREALFLAPWSLLLATNESARKAQDEWDENSYQVFVQLNAGASFDQVSAKIRGIRMKRDNPPPYQPAFFLHPMSRWHLYSDFDDGVNVGGQIQFVWLFGFIGGFVLLLACINFMNLSTARSAKRAKEVGIRKTIGSVRGQLIAQFITESLLVTGLAFVLALLLMYLLLPFFNEVANKQLTLGWRSPGFWSLGIGFCLFTGLLAASYPALYLSSFQPVKVLKGTFQAGRLAALPRQALVVFQFGVSVTLMIGTLVVLRQIEFAKDRPVGYSHQGLIEVDMNTPALYGHYEALRTDLLASGAVVEMAESMGSVTQDFGGTLAVSWPGKPPGLNTLLMDNRITHDYGKTMGWQVVAGRDFSRAFPTDSSGIILNESAVKLMGLDQPIGERITWIDKEYRVIGIVKDFIKGNPFEPVSPSFFTLNYESVTVVNLRLSPHLAAKESLDRIADVFRRYNPAAPFEYTFVDAKYGEKFAEEERIGKLTSVFALLTIFISCLGIFGLASFMTEIRTKEIGVRKVLGASVLSLWNLLSKDFIRLVVVAFGLAAPVAHYFLQAWLQDYTYRIELSWWLFAAAGVGALLITLLTVSFQAIKAALTNPVKSLRTE